MRYLRSAALFTAAYVILAMGIVSEVHAQPYSWRLMGRILSTAGKWEGYCGFFWNSQIGVVANTTQFFYTRDGHTWTPSLAFPKGTWINSIRCFDGHTLYAAVTGAGRDTTTYNSTLSAELWTSADSGTSWTRLAKSTAHYGLDVFWSYITNSATLSNSLPEPINPWQFDYFQGTSVARMDSLRLAASFDDGIEQLPLYTIDGGVKWYEPAYTLSNIPPECGYGISADTLNKLFYYAHESNTPGLSVSSNSGADWTQLTNLPKSQYWNDDVESGGGRTYIQTSDGVYVTSNAGESWVLVSSPSQSANFDDSHFCVLGCHGLTVVVFNEFGIWISNEWDAPGPTLLHSNFQTTARECDTSLMTIGLDSSTAPGMYIVKITGDTDGVFTLLGSDTLNIPEDRRNILVQFHAHDIENHTATISLAPLTDAVCQTGDSHTIAGRAYLGPPQITVLSPVVVCSAGSSKIYLSNPTCDSMLIARVTTDPSITVHPFDSVIRGLDSISLSVNPAAHDTSIHSLIHFSGKYLPSDSAFNMTVEIIVKTTHIRSTLGWSSVASLAFAQPTSCDPVDTTIVLWNTGCDTIAVDLDQTNPISRCWHVTSNTGVQILYPGQADTVQIHFYSSIPGTYTQALDYLYSYGLSGHDSVSFALSAIVPSVQPNLFLSPVAVDFGRRPLCTDTSVLVRLRNMGCDTAIVSNIHFASGTTFLLVSSTDTIIPPNQELDETIDYYPTQHGVIWDTLSMQIASLDSTYSIDTSILCRVEVTRGTATIEATATSYDLDTTTICQERDTFVVIQNTGCDTVCDSSLTIAPGTFQLAKPWVARCLAPGDRDTVWLVSIVDTSGRSQQNSATLTIASNADAPLSPIALMREIEYPALWHLSMSAPDSAYAGQSVAYQIIQHGTLPTDDTAIDFVLHCDNDLLEFESVDEPFVSVQVQAGGVALHIATVPADSILATLHFKAFFAPIQNTRLWMDGVAFSSSPARPSDCIAVATLDTSAFNLRMACGSRETSQDLNGIPLTLDAIVPNPAHNEVTLYYSVVGTANITGNITLEDALGRTTYSKAMTLGAGSHQITLDLSGIPSGVYTVRLPSTTLWPSISKRIVKE